MQTLMLTVEYDGTRYAGWKAAPKKENLDTVLGRIHTALARLLKEDIQLFCAAKTDPGVHARGQTVSYTHLITSTNSFIYAHLRETAYFSIPAALKIFPTTSVG